MSSHYPLILASTSKYRAELIQKMHIPFICQKPNIDEEALKNICLNEKKSPVEIADYLSQEKTKSIFKKNTVVVGGDQLVSHNNNILGKPYNFDNAFLQLKILNNSWHDLITAVTVMTDEKTFHINHITKLKMKNFTDNEIKNYLTIDLPYDCAGSYKIESAGLCLFEKIECDDFSAIQGLPMIWLSTRLKGCGYELYKKQS